MKRVLAIDGGGIRGIIPAEICVYIEAVTGKRIADLFDLIAGTSTGGLLALALAKPPRGTPAKDLSLFYTHSGPTIFSKPAMMGTDKLNPKYGNGDLQDAVQSVLGSELMKNALCELLIIAYDTQSRTPKYFSRQDDQNLTMWSAAMATSAAPTYFPTFEVENRFYVDGGLVSNNPSLLAYGQAKKLWPKEEILLLSLGTGSVVKPLTALRTAKWGQLQWVLPLIDSVLDGTSRATHHVLEDMVTDGYLRLQGGLNQYTERLDDAGPRSLDGLKAIAGDLINSKQAELNRFLLRLEAAGAPLEARILVPAEDDQTAYGKVRLEGTVSNLREEKLCVFAQWGDRYFPSSPITATNGTWSAQINLSKSIMRAGEKTRLLLVSLNSSLDDYVCSYRENVLDVVQFRPGMLISSFPPVLDSKTIYLKRTPIGV